MTKVILAAGGSPANWPDLTDWLSEDTYFVGIDRGSLYLIEKGYQLHAAIGDFDSLTAVELSIVEQTADIVKYSQAEKDDTDTQLALQYALEQFPEAQVLLIGATGGRIDHLLANLWLPLEPRFEPFIRQIRLADDQNQVDYYLPGAYTVTRLAGMTYLAYCCLTPVAGLTLVDSKYLLDEVDVSVPTSYASNEFVGNSASFSFKTGVIAVIQSKDREKRE